MQCLVSNGPFSVGWLCWALHSDEGRWQPQNDDNDDIMSNVDGVQCRYADRQGERCQIGTYLDEINLSMFTTERMLCLFCNYLR
jgi:hypothetical protein